MGLQKPSEMPCNRQLINVWSSQGNFKPWPYHVDLAIAQSMWQGLRFSCKDLTLG